MSSKLDIVSQIRHYKSQNETGALFLKLSDNKLLQLFFEKGELRSAKYHGLNGIDALKKVSSIAVIKGQFHKGAVSRVSHPLPETSELIQMMMDGSFDLPTGASSESVGYINESQKTIIKSLFIDYVGPIAEFIFSEELEKSISIDDLIVSLSLQMDDVDDQLKFTQEARVAINQ